MAADQETLQPENTSGQTANQAAIVYADFNVER